MWLRLLKKSLLRWSCCSDSIHLLISGGFSDDGIPDTIGNMIILGLRFGHDAGILLLRDGKVERSLIRERHNRVKHVFSMDTAHIDLVLEEAGLSVDAIDMIALTSTQCYGVKRTEINGWSNVRFGSKADSLRLPSECPLLGVKRT